MINLAYSQREELDLDQSIRGMADEHFPLLARFFKTF